jgi:hypothetical protein
MQKSAEFRFASRAPHNPNTPAIFSFSAGKQLLRNAQYKSLIEKVKRENSTIHEHG